MSNYTCDDCYRNNSISDDVKKGTRIAEFKLALKMACELIQKQIHDEATEKGRTAYVKIYVKHFFNKAKRELKERGTE